MKLWRSRLLTESKFWCKKGNYSDGEEVVLVTDYKCLGADGGILYVNTEGVISGEIQSIYCNMLRMLAMYTLLPALCVLKAERYGVLVLRSFAHIDLACTAVERGNCHSQFDLSLE